MKHTSRIAFFSSIGGNHPSPNSDNFLLYETMKKKNTKTADAVLNLNNFTIKIYQEKVKY